MQAGLMECELPGLFAYGPGSPSHPGQERERAALNGAKIYKLESNS
jgi:hypothetical protein